MNNMSFFDARWFLIKASKRVNEPVVINTETV